MRMIVFQHHKRLALAAAAPAEPAHRVDGGAAGAIAENFGARAERNQAVHHFPASIVASIQMFGFVDRQRFANFSPSAARAGVSGLPSRPIDWIVEAKSWPDRTLRPGSISACQQLGPQPAASHDRYSQAHSTQFEAVAIAMSSHKCPVSPSGFECSQTSVRQKWPHATVSPTVGLQWNRRNAAWPRLP